MDEADSPLDGPGGADLESIGRGLDEAQRQIRDNEVDPDLLEELGMTQPEFRNFVDRYSQRYGRPDENPSQTPRPDGTGPRVPLPGEEGVQRGSGLRTDLGTVEGPADRQSDDVRDLREGGGADVPPEYREHVEDYYRAVGAGRTDEATGGE